MPADGMRAAIDAKTEVRRPFLGSSKANVTGFLDVWKVEGSTPGACPRAVTIRPN